MKKIIKNQIAEVSKIRLWSDKNLVGIFVFNSILMLLILLHAAGYFAPYFPITINFIIFVCLIMAVVLFKAQSNFIFFIALLFWLFAGFLRTLKVEVWAERTAVYAYQALIVGFLVFVVESIRARGKS